MSFLSRQRRQEKARFTKRNGRSSMMRYLSSKMSSQGRNRLGVKRFSPTSNKFCNLSWTSQQTRLVSSKANSSTRNARSIGSRSTRMTSLISWKISQLKTRSRKQWYLVRPQLTQRRTRNSGSSITRSRPWDRTRSYSRRRWMSLIGMYMSEDQFRKSSWSWEKDQWPKREKLPDLSEKTTGSKLICTVLMPSLAMLAEDTLLTHQAIHNRRELRSTSTSSIHSLIMQRPQDRTILTLTSELYRGSFQRSVA